MPVQRSDRAEVKKISRNNVIREELESLGEKELLQNCFINETQY